MQVSTKHAFLFLLGLLASAAGAIPPPWIPLGPYGGAVRTLTADPTRSGTVYATTYGAIFKTVDGGASWALISLEQPASNVAVDPAPPSTLYVGVASEELLLKSTDGGAHWAASALGLSGNPHFEFPQSVAVDPSNPRHLLLVDAGRVWRSVDAGASWQPAGNGLPTALVGQAEKVVFASRPAGTAYATTGQGLYRTLDAGLSWKRLDPALPTSFVLSLALSPSDPKTLYEHLAGFGFYRTFNGGASWSKIPGPSALFNGGLTVAPRSPRTLYASSATGSLYRSTDGGAHWSTLSGVTAVTSLAFDPADPRRIYAGSIVQPLGGVWRSDDGGDSWARRSQGMTGLETPLLAVDPLAPERLWTTVGTGLFRSENGGTRWARVTSPSPDPLNQLAVGASSALLAGVPFKIPRGPVEHSTFKTVNGGGSWKEVLDFLQVNARQILAAPSDRGTLYVMGTSPGGGILEIYRSMDNGETWQPRTVPSEACGLKTLAVAPASASVLYLSAGVYNAAAFLCEPAVFRSADGGATWALASAGLPARDALALAVDPGDPDQVYAGTAGDGVWKSADGGRSWSPAGLAGQNVTSLLASEVPGRLYAVAAGRVFRSDDGATWQGWSRGLRTLGIDALAAAPGDPQRIYAATLNGVWVLTETD